METTIITPPSSGILTYPVIAQAYEGDIIVLFSSEYEGTVIHSNSTEYYVGYYSDEWSSVYIKSSWTILPEITINFKS